MNLFRRNAKKENVGHRLQYEIIEAQKRKYQDPLIAGGYHDYFGNYSRKEVCLNDPIGERLTMGYMKTMLMKYPKFTANDEVQTEYIMDDVRQAIQFLNLREPLCEIGTNCLISGWSLVLWLLEDNQLVPKIFGWDECHPRFWTRFTQIEKANAIYKYKAYYIPYPHGREAAHFGMKQERYIMFPQQPNFQHLTRISFNRGLGYARIQPIWDAITKLRERSDSEHFRSSNFMEARYPKSYKATGQAKEFIDKVRKTDRSTGIAIEEYTNPKTGDPTGLPSVIYRPWSQGAEGQKFDVNRTTFLDNEWARLLCNLGYSQVWAVGTQAGQQEGSEINLTRDDRADIAEFSLIAPIIKKILKRLCELGIFGLLDVSKESQELLLSEEYQIVSWKTWEYNDKIAMQQQQALMQHQLEQERGEDEERNAYDQEKQNAFRINEKVHLAIIDALRNNYDVPMTPIMSSWAEKAGVYKGHLLIKYHDEPDIFGYPYGGNEANEQYLDMMEAGSKGGWIWDNILKRPSEGGIVKGSMFITSEGKPMFTKGTEIFHQTPPGRPARFKYQPVPDFGAAAGTPEEMREFKMYGEKETATKGLGTSREPFPLPPSKPETPTGLPEYEPLEQYYDIPKRYWNPTIIRKSSLPPLFKLSRKKFNEAAKKLGIDTFGSRSIDKVKELVKKAEEYRKNNQIRYNSISIGNPMSFDIPLYYDIEGKISEEYPCVREWKKIENHTGNLWLYNDLGHGGDRITVGTYEYLGWDDEKELPLVKFDYDEKLIRQKVGNSNSEIIKRLDAGLEPEMSTEYYCKTVNHEGKTWQMDFRDSQGRPRFDGIAIVEFGNCPSNHCSFERLNVWRMNPFAGYKDFDDCVAKNKDKEDPKAYCGKIKHKVENSFNELIEWVRKTIGSEDAESIAWAIAKARKDGGKKDIGKKEDWKKTWASIGTTFEKYREARTRYRRYRETGLR